MQKGLPKSSKFQVPKLHVNMANFKWFNGQNYGWQKFRYPWFPMGP